MITKWINIVSEVLPEQRLKEEISRTNPLFNKASLPPMLSLFAQFYLFYDMFIFIIISADKGLAEAFSIQYLLSDELDQSFPVELSRTLSFSTCVVQNGSYCARYGNST